MEIEVTPEMIEAGLDEFFSHDMQLDVQFGGPSPEAWREVFAQALKAALSVRS